MGALRLVIFISTQLLPLLALALPQADIVFVTQVPHPRDFATIVSTFGNQQTDMEAATRGGDLYIRYQDGTLKNLTAAAGYGVSGFQNQNAIAVRDPAVHWDGNKVLFSMVIGAPTQRYQVNTYYWQLYEMTGLSKFDAPVITKVLNQPENYNNIMGVYGSDDAIIFSSDRPRSGERHLYPQRDEYESTATTTGIWKLIPSSGALQLLDHAPSGAFHPIIDSAGRIIYTRWDHLQRDQQAGGLTAYGAFNFSDESEHATRINSQIEHFPEPRDERERVESTLNLHRFNHFFPWQLNQDGTEHETVNHIGRHELHSYFDRSFNNDPSLDEFFGQAMHRTNANPIESLHQIRENPLVPGEFWGVDCPEFGTHASGQIVKIRLQVGTNPDASTVTYITHRDTRGTDDTPSVSHSGLYRNPLPLSDGSVVAVHTSETRQDRNIGSSSAPRSLYDFKIKPITISNGASVAGASLTGGISKSITYWSPDESIIFTGNLWELQPVERKSRSRPIAPVPQLQSPEAQIFAQESASLSDLVAYLRANNLALIVSRNVTNRDGNDLQQPFNLQVAGGGAQTVRDGGKKYEVEHLQIFQGDSVRGYGGVANPQAGRRLLPIPMHGVPTQTESGAPEGSVRIGADGSMAAFVPAQRALTWQLTDGAGKGVVRERYWLTFQPGEVRVCASCHGVNTADQAGQTAPTNPPEALRDIIRLWKGLPPTSRTPTPTPAAGSVQIQISSTSIARRTSASRMRSNERGKIVLRGSIQPNDTLAITLERTRCRIGTRRVQAARTLTVAMPRFKKNRTIAVQLQRGSVTIASARASLTGEHSVRSRDQDQINAICKAFQRAAFR